MRTLLIAGADPVPPRLRELVDLGSTSVPKRRSAADRLEVAFLTCVRTRK
jgi:hypothetical protein